MLHLLHLANVSYDQLWRTLSLTFEWDRSRMCRQP